MNYWSEQFYRLVNFININKKFYNIYITLHDMKIEIATEY